MQEPTMHGYVEVVWGHGQKQDYRSFTSQSIRESHVIDEYKRSVQSAYYCSHSMLRCTFDVPVSIDGKMLCAFLHMIWLTHSENPQDETWIWEEDKRTLVFIGEFLSFGSLLKAWNAAGLLCSPICRLKFMYFYTHVYHSIHVYNERIHNVLVYCS